MAECRSLAHRSVSNLPRHSTALEPTVSPLRGLSALAAGADVNARNKVGDTALHAAAGGDAGAIESLLAAGAGSDVNARQKDGYTPPALCRHVGR